MSLGVGCQKSGRFDQSCFGMSRGAGSTSELNRVGLVAVFLILIRELDSASSFLPRLETR
jgi:hypothetical protein